MSSYNVSSGSDYTAGQVDLVSDTTINVETVTTQSTTDSITGELVNSIESLPELSDSLKKVRQPKDTTYYSFYGHIIHISDSQKVGYWNYNQATNVIQMSYYDSALNNMYLDHPAYEYSVNNNYLGHTGLASKSNLYFEQQPETKFMFAQGYSSYYFHANNAKYYNVRNPFTKFNVSISSRDEQNVNILHTQNVNQYFNFFAHYKSATGLGTYPRRKSRNNATIAGFSFNKKWLSTHAAIAFNKISVNESGGILDTRYITDTILDEANVGARITDGETAIKNKQVFLDQKIGFVKARMKDTTGIGGYWFSLQYNYQWDNSFKQYTHTTDNYLNPITLRDSNFYKNNYSNNPKTFDSCSYVSHENVFRLRLEEIPGKFPGFGAYGGIGFNYYKNYYFNKDSIFRNSHSNYFRDRYLEAGIYRLQSKYINFSGKYKLFIYGRRKGDMEMYGSVFQNFGRNKWAFTVRFEGDVIKQTPDYFYYQYYSNHFRWNNNFEAPVSTTMQAKIDMPGLNTYIGWRNSFITDYIYFNTEAVPQQYDQGLNVFDVYFKNRLPFWRFALVTQLNYQNSDNADVLPVPELTYYGAFMFESPVHFKSTDGHMKIQLGADVLYWSEFYSQEYIPSLASFANQTVQKTGNYPFMGAFTSIEIKRLRFYFRFEHLNSKYSDRNFFMSPSYPAKEFNLRYGLVWTFYN